MDLNTYLEQLPHGGKTRLAKEAGIGTVFLWQIANGQRKASPEKAKAIEEATGGLVKRHELRPDIYDAPVEQVA